MAQSEKDRVAKAIKNAVVFDTFRGKARVRPKPPSKHPEPGSPRDRSMRYFAAANRIAGVWEATWHAQVLEAIEGTPFYPRDPWLKAMYGRIIGGIDETGRQWHSMANRNEVSKSLDVLGSIEGSMLVRGADFWEARQAALTAHGAKIVLAVNGPTVDMRAGYYIPFDTAVFDTHAFFQPAEPTHKLVIPAGYRFAELVGGLNLGGLATLGFQDLRLNRVRAGVETTIASDRGSQVAGETRQTTPTGLIDVEEGDKFGLRVIVQNDASTNTVFVATFLTIHAYE